MSSHERRSYRLTEATLLVVVWTFAVLGFVMVAVARQVLQEQDPWALLPGALLPPMTVGVGLLALHVLLWQKGMNLEQILLPIVGLLLVIGLTMIWRLQGEQGVGQQLLRGFIPGCGVAALLVLRPQLIESIRRWAVPLSLVGLSLPIATALFGVVDETGSRLALRLGPLPAIQTSELIKVTLVVFLAWYIDREGKTIQGRARPILGWLRLPAVRYFIPGILMVSMATLALVQMSDYGAALIIVCLFVTMLYAGFDTRIFATIALIGLWLAALAGLALAFTWEVPTVIRYRFLAFRDPWSEAMILVNGQPTGLSISEGPGYQIQQAIYATIAGGLTGRGLGFGSPEYIPLAHSDFIFAAILEEMGAVIGVAVLILFAVLILRVLRIAALLPSGQVFERLLLVGVAVHFFIQVFVMVAGTLNLLPMTGITIPFLSLGGMALLVNLAEVGLVLALAQRLEAPTL